MNAQLGFDKCLPFINSQIVSAGPIVGQTVESPRFVVTISRQTGCGAHEIAQRLASYLGTHAPNDSYPWLVFDRNLVERVLEDHNLPTRLARFMPEDSTPELADALEELLGAHPPSWTLVRQTTETILSLAKRGNVILIGRGAHLITSGQSDVLHVRLIGSIKKRVEHIQELHGIGPDAARKLIQAEDRGRKRYLRKYFDKDLDDPLLYHLILNTDQVPYDRAAWFIGEAVLNRIHSRKLINARMG